MIFYQLKST